MPAGVCAMAFASRARPIWSTRSSSASAHASGSVSSERPCPAPSAMGRSSSTSARPTSRKHDLLALDAEPPGVHPREIEQVGGELGEPVDLLARRREEAGAGLLVEVLVRQSSRKPPSENSGVRSSCDAFATNSFRAVSSWASWTRIRSNAAASSPSSSSPSSTTGSSNLPSAIRFAARSSRRIRRACTAAAALPEDRRDQQRHARRVEEPALHDADGRELVLDRDDEEEDVPRREQAAPRPARTAGRRVRPVLERSAWCGPSAARRGRPSLAAPTTPSPRAA